MKQILLAFVSSYANVNLIDNVHSVVDEYEYESIHDWTKV